MTFGVAPDRPLVKLAMVISRLEMPYQLLHLLLKNFMKSLNRTTAKKMIDAGNYFGMLVFFCFAPQ